MYKCWAYECQWCGWSFEELTENDEPIACPECKETATRLLGTNNSRPADPKMTELTIKWRKSYNKMKDTSPDTRGRIY